MKTYVYNSLSVFIRFFLHSEDNQDFDLAQYTWFHKSLIYLNKMFDGLSWKKPVHRAKMRLKKTIITFLWHANTYQVNCNHTVPENSSEQSAPLNGWDSLTYLPSYLQGKYDFIQSYCPPLFTKAAHTLPESCTVLSTPTPTPPQQHLVIGEISHTLKTHVHIHIHTNQEDLWEGSYKDQSCNTQGWARGRDWSCITLSKHTQERPVSW